MPFISDGRKLVQHAFNNNYAMPAFNICSLEMAKACVMAAEAEEAPIIIQTYPGDLKHASPKVMQAMVKALAEEASVPIMLHLDHGEGLSMAVSCLRAGYSSVMFDGAEESLAENIAKSRRLAEVAHAAGASLEVTADAFEDGQAMSDLDDTKALMDGSGADKIAIAVGSRHGQSSRLDLAHLSALASNLGRPLVLHGGSGIAAEDLAEAVKLGVVKVNIGAALLRNLLASWSKEAPSAKLHYEVFDFARNNLIEVARDKIRIMKASGKAAGF
ncbi:MAG: class II fructose-bisphosphate aldolase [Deinococcales bacterium]